MNGSRTRRSPFEPNPELDVRTVLDVVLGALADNDRPRPDHGIDVTYAFASDRMRAGIGNADAFGRALHNTLNAPLLSHASAAVERFERRGDAARADVRVTCREGAHARFTLALVRARHGTRQGCWLLSGLARDGVDL